MLKDCSVILEQAVTKATYLALAKCGARESLQHHEETSHNIIQIPL